MNELIGLAYSDYDCYQLVRRASRVLYGKVLPDIADYVRAPFDAIEENRPKWKELSAPELGCVVVLGQSPGFAKHVGIWVGNGVLHATRKYGSVVQDEYQLLSAGYSHLRYYKWEN